MDIVIFLLKYGLLIASIYFAANTILTFIGVVKIVFSGQAYKINLSGQFLFYAFIWASTIMTLWA